MAVPRVLVLRAPGTNCDVETAFAFEQCGATAERLHLFRLLEQPEVLRDYQILCIPGGFSYGDDVGAGVIFASQLRNHLAGVLQEFLTADKLVLGICNGFQVLMRAGLLPGGASQWPPAEGSTPQATLTWNDNGKFTARWVHMVTAGSKSVFLKGIDELELPIAHAEGKVVARDEGVLQSWKAEQQIALCYAKTAPRAPKVRKGRGAKAQAAAAAATAAGAPAMKPAARDVDLFAPLRAPVNPNGSVWNIAGLCDPTGRVLGLMPHPERFIHATQHPNWTRRKAGSDEGQGLQLFRNAVAYFGG